MHIYDSMVRERSTSSYCYCTQPCLEYRLFWQELSNSFFSNCFHPFFMFYVSLLLDPSRVTELYTVQAERDLRRTPVLLLAQISVKSNILPWTLSVQFLKPSKDAYCTVCLGSLSCCLTKNQNYTWFGLLPFSLLFISSFIYFIALKLNRGFGSLILNSPFRYWKGTSGHLQNLLFSSLTKSSSSNLSLYGACSSPSDLGGLPLGSLKVCWYPSCSAMDMLIITGHSSPGVL